ncbi:MAG: Rdx family protein [Pseudomonadota bacterium]
MPAAASLAATIKESLGVEAALTRGAGGIFDVTIDGHLLYSKFETHQFPDESEIVSLIAQRRAADA